MTSRAYRPRSGPRSTGGIRATWARWVSNTYRYGPLIAVLGLWFYISNQWGTGAIGGAVLTLLIFAAALFASWRRRLAVMHKTDRAYYIPFWTHVLHLVRVWRLFCFWARAIASLTMTNRGVTVLPPPRPFGYRDGLRWRYPDGVWWLLDGSGTPQGNLRHGPYGVTSEALMSKSHALAEYLGADEVTIRHQRRAAESRRSILGQLATAWGPVSGTSEIRIYYVNSMGRTTYLRELPIAPKGKIAFGRHADGSCAYLSTGTSILISGMSGSGKSNTVWTVLADLRRQEIPVRLYVSDAKGGQELAVLKDWLGNTSNPLFEVRNYAPSVKGTTAMVKSLYGAMEKRQQVFADRRQRKHTPTLEDPLTILIIDELLILDKDLRTDTDGPLGALLTQGRSTGFIVIALTQDPTKESVGNLRDSFPQRIALKLPGPLSSKPALGIDAPCHLITEPGVGYVMKDGEYAATKFRGPYVNDKEVERIARGELLDMPGDEVKGEPTVLYRYYGTLPVDEYPDLEGRMTLLYVGITSDFERRDAQHRAEKAWTDYIDDSKTVVETWPSRERALAEEEKAIKTEMPVFNDQHNADNPRRRDTVKRSWMDPRRQAEIRHWKGRRATTRPKVTAS